MYLDVKGWLLIPMDACHLRGSREEDFQPALAAREYQCTVVTDTVIHLPGTRLKQPTQYSGFCHLDKESANFLEPPVMLFCDRTCPTWTHACCVGCVRLCTRR